MDPRPRLALSGIAKAFGGVQALAAASLELYAGQITALIGENGAGKSTLVKILTGVHRADAGTIRLDGEPVAITRPTVAQALGISVVHQEAVIFDDLSVAENIFVTELPVRRGLVDWKALNRRAAELLAQLDAEIDPRQPAARLSVAEKHLVQIARALACECNTLILDEPTAGLSHHEVDDLFAIVRRLRDKGCAVLFISHRFEEVFALCDRYAVFRDGRTVDSGFISDTDTDALIAQMVGRPLDQIYPKVAITPGEQRLAVSGLGRSREFADINFSVRAGEILGVYGLVGAGRSEVMRTIFGVTRPDEGTILLDGQVVEHRRPSDAIAAGLAYVPEDRQSEGGALGLTIADNIALPSLRSLTRAGFLSPRRERSFAEALAEQFKVKAGATSDPLESLSGGNQQKVVLAKWVGTKPRVLILDEPTKGIDVGSKAAVHGAISALAEQGLAVVMVSSDLPEVLGMADRIMVMRRGRVTATLDRADASPERVMRHAMAA